MSKDLEAGFDAKDEKITLWWPKASCGAKEKRTILHPLLHRTINSDKIILNKLDSCISSKDENDTILVDLAPLLEEGTVNEEDLIKDLLDLKTKDALAKVLFHPVIQTFLQSRWHKIHLAFFLNFLAYCLFLMSYSVYLANIFYRPINVQRKVVISEIIAGEDRVVFPTGVSLVGEDIAQGGDHYNWTYADDSKALFRSCHAHHDGAAATCSFEVVLVISILLLLLQEVMQLVTLGIKRYLREFENMLEMTILALAISGLFLQNHSVRALKWVSAFGICGAYFEFIFLLGRYPALGGQTSLMLYSITSRLLRSLTNFLVLVVGFGFGFFIISHGKTGESFENPFKAVAKTLTMTLGEFNFDDVYEAHGDNVYSRTFAICLLIMLAVMGCLVLVNLIVALIVSDIKDLKREAQLQELVNKAQHILYVRSQLRFCFRKSQTSPLNSSNTVSVCAHSLCRCDAQKLHADIVGELRRILRKRKMAEVLAVGNLGEGLRSLLVLQQQLSGKEMAEVMFGSD